MLYVVRADKVSFSLHIYECESLVDASKKRQDMMYQIIAR